MDRRRSTYCYPRRDTEADRSTALADCLTPTPDMLVTDTLAELQAQLPPGLVQSDRQPVDPRGVVEYWFPA